VTLRKRVILRGPDLIEYSSENFKGPWLFLKTELSGSQRKCSISMIKDEGGM
jgi:hypothetical protein